MADLAGEQLSLADRHESQETEDGVRTVKYAFALKNNDWEAYHRYRPAYPPSMWNMWFGYHEEHGGQFEVAHDLGAGKQLLPDRQLLPHSSPPTNASPQAPARWRPCSASASHTP